MRDLRVGRKDGSSSPFSIFYQVICLIFKFYSYLASRIHFAAYKL